MGAWGTGPFDNDTAADWVYQLEKSQNLSVLSQALQPESGYLDADAGCELLAAAAVVADLDLSDSARAWRASHAALDFASLRRAARAGLERVLGSDSELRDLWAEAEPEEWLAAVERLRQSLG